MTVPTLRLESLGAGVQSTTMALMSAEGVLPKLDGAIFADTGWEPRAVYEHLDRLAPVLAAAGIPVYRVRRGNLRADLLDPDKMAMIPAYTLGPAYPVTVIDRSRACESCDWGRYRAELDKAGSPDDYIEPEDYQAALAGLDGLRPPEGCAGCDCSGVVILQSHVVMRRDPGMLKRKCTGTYKLGPVRRQTRLLLGGQVSGHPCRHCEGAGTRVAPWRRKRGDLVLGRCSVCDGSGSVSLTGQPPAAAWAETWVGFSTDEIGRVSAGTDTRYSRSRHPLLELGMSREMCEAWLLSRGWGSVAKSACVGCPYHGNAYWRRMRDERPGEWADAVSFDEEYRAGPGMRGERFLHSSCVPLAAAPVDRVQPKEYQQLDLLDLEYEKRLEDGDPDGCSPYGCRSGAPIGGES